MVLALAVGVAGALGAVARYLLDGWVQDRTSGLFPFGTLACNVVGSVSFGMLAGLALGHAGQGSQHLRIVAGTGLCGGLTTWSTASWETVRLAEEAGPVLAARHACVHLAASLAAAALGLAVGLAV